MCGQIDFRALATIPDDIHSQLKQLGDYDDPCLLFIYSDAEKAPMQAIVQQVYCSQGQTDVLLYAVTEQLSFSYLFCDAKAAIALAQQLTTALNAHGMASKVSLFRHNCLGDIAQTYQWGLLQLSNLMADTSCYAVNDFTDKANWPGIALYREADKKAKAQAQQIEIDAFAKQHPLPESLANFPPSLKQLYPFIVALPQGEVLWHYVLTGEHEAALRQQQIFENLDAVLVIRHAKTHALDFYYHILRCCAQSAIPAQNTILSDLDDILTPLANELLLPDVTSSVKQACFIRIVDIFYHLFDQQDLPKALYQMMVGDSDTRCLSDAEFHRRYTQPERIVAEGLSAKQKRQIDEILDTLEDYDCFNYNDYLEIERAFDGNRQAYDFKLWMREDDEQIHSRLLGAILLDFDRTHQRNDHLTQALTEWVCAGLKEDVLTQIEAASDNFAQRALAQGLSQSLFDHLKAWLDAGDISELPALVQALQQCLKQERSGRWYQQTPTMAQPRYKLFDDLDLFWPVLGTCFWLYRAQSNAFAKRVILLSMALAPQATLAAMSRCYRQARGGFASEAHQNHFNMQLLELGISYLDQVAFQIALCMDDGDKLIQLIQRYNDLDDDERAQWQGAINRLSPYKRDYFYLHAYRLSSQVPEPLREMRQTVLNELMTVVCFDIQDAPMLADAAAKLIDGELSYSVFQALTQGKIDSEEFALGNDMYCSLAPKILPQILTESDQDKQLRWLKLMCCDPHRGRKLQADLLEALFFDRVLAEGHLSFQDRLTIDLDDLTAQWQATWQQFYADMSAKLQAIH
ncbi:hypothetical protein VST7929_01072 [Vibrio stylophorae]|uniref:Uncharacterized protein n=1 Tax=Vibrio stylophorae TaxID=659351 RepID=A0ABN8DS97_9VIBR|nr:hypothetical protein [Vibrio stylophorae]CAH0533208.1 hypothetical protein VST7929_01072 [Vibrio stylophorae]